MLSKTKRNYCLRTGIKNHCRLVVRYKIFKLKTVRNRILMRGASYFRQLFINLCKFGVQVLFTLFVSFKEQGRCKKGGGQFVKVGMVGVVREHENRKN